MDHSNLKEGMQTEQNYGFENFTAKEEVSEGKGSQAGCDTVKR